MLFQEELIPEIDDDAEQRTQHHRERQPQAPDQQSRLDGFHFLADTVAIERHQQDQLGTPDGRQTDADRVPASEETHGQDTNAMDTRHPVKTVSFDGFYPFGGIEEI